jgi:uncharacterized protein (DUF2342 family)
MRGSWRPADKPARASASLGLRSKPRGSEEAKRLWARVAGEAGPQGFGLSTVGEP